MSRKKKSKDNSFTPWGVPDGCDPLIAWEILKRLDLLAEYKKIGFRPLPGAVPDQLEGLEGTSLFGSGNRAFINLGWGPERVVYTEELPSQDHQDLH
jgi:hypothetical protein